ncbi:mitogen-activated protein kinase 4 [Haematococcus lacustris]
MLPPDVQPTRDTNPAGPSGASSFSGNSESKRYTVQEVIGKGSYGVVCGAIDNLTGERVAIKKIRIAFDNLAEATRILREIKLLRLLKHADVVDVKHIILPSNPQSFKHVFVVFERMESDLHTVIQSNDDLDHHHHKVFLYQLLRGLNFIHASGVLHRDLKPRNILANSTCKLKICDFGLARPFIPDNAMSPVFWTDYVATRWYRAPELCGRFYGHYCQAVDIWSVGCIFAEVLLGTPLFKGSDAMNQLQLITDLLGKPPPAVIDGISDVKARTFLAALPPKQPRDLADKFPSAHPAALAMLRRLLSFDPLDRPTAARALEDPYFDELREATEQEPAMDVAAHFGFERSRLNEHEIRALIYQEVCDHGPEES